MREELNTLIASAMKQGNKVEINTLRAIKTAFTNYEKEGKTLTDADEVKILLKMKSQREDAISQYKAGNRADLVENETDELNCLLQYIPEQPSDEDIIAYTKEIASQIQGLSMKDMKGIMQKVQDKFPTASVGKTVSSVVKSMC